MCVAVDTDIFLFDMLKAIILKKYAVLRNLFYFQ